MPRERPGCSLSAVRPGLCARDLILSSEDTEGGERVSPPLPSQGRLLEATQLVSSRAGV